jgi:hypothetical protein
MSAPIRPAITSTVDLLATVPHLLGFHPTDSLVVLALRGGRVVFAARGDLPRRRASKASLGAHADQIAGVVARQEAQAASVIGYGPPERVERAVTAICAALADHRVDVVDVLRVTAGRYWPVGCDNPECCPPEGTPFDVTTSPIAAEAVFAGQVVLPNRTALIRSVAPVRGAARKSMSQATLRAIDRLAPLSLEAAHREGKAAVRSALAGAEAGGRLTDDEVAWLTLLLCHQPVRDLAWRLTTPDDWQTTLWTDVLTRAEPDLAAAPATLLAYAAWRCGNGALASVALERALRTNPEYPMALLLDETIQDGTPPSILDGFVR